MKSFENISDHQNLVFENAEYYSFWHSQNTDIQYRYNRKTASNSTGKELDAETGFSYFGARYLDHTLTTSWLSVDPMADKYPSISPYAYCAWNPVKLVDPDGEDFIVIVNHKDKTVTIKAQYATDLNNEDARKSLETALKTWNDLSGKYSLKAGDEIYRIDFDLSIIDLSKYDDNTLGQNTYKLTQSFEDKNDAGKTDIRHINVLESWKDDYTVSSHEVGHTLGLPHNGYELGLMEEDSGRKSGNHHITTRNIEDIIRYAVWPETRNDKLNTGRGELIEEGPPAFNINNKVLWRVMKNKKK